MLIRDTDTFDLIVIGQTDKGLTQLPVSSAELPSADKPYYTLTMEGGDIQYLPASTPIQVHQRKKVRIVKPKVDVPLDIKLTAR